MSCPVAAPVIRLEKLKCQGEAGGTQSEICRIELYDWSAPDVGSDKPLCLGDRT
jgi:hypothetical protein